MPKKSFILQEVYSKLENNFEDLAEDKVYIVSSMIVPNYQLKRTTKSKDQYLLIVTNMCFQ